MAADLDVICMIFADTECKGYGATAAPTKISEENLGGQGVCCGVKSHSIDSTAVKLICRSKKVGNQQPTMPDFCWKPQKAAMWAETSKYSHSGGDAQGLGSSSLATVCPDARQTALGFF